MNGTAARPFTGRHMAIIMVAFFAVIFAVNFTMAGLAGSSFTGIVVENSYVASQHYNRWLAEARAEDRLGWSARVRREPDGKLTLALSGAPVGARVTATAWHPLDRAPDRALTFVPAGAVYRSAEAIPAGRWRIRIEVRAKGQRWRTEETVS